MELRVRARARARARARCRVGARVGWRACGMASSVTSESDETSMRNPPSCAASFVLAAST